MQNNKNGKDICVFLQAEFQNSLNCLSVFAISITLVVTRVPKSGSHVIKGKLGLLNSGVLSIGKPKLLLSVSLQ